MFLLGYLRAMAAEADESSGRISKVAGFLLPLASAAAAFGIGPVKAADIANIAIGLGVGGVLWFVVIFLVVAPARYWKRAEEEKKRAAEEKKRAAEEKKRAAEEKQAAPVETHYHYSNYNFILGNVPPNQATTASGTAIVTPAAPQCPEPSTHDQ